MSQQAVEDVFGDLIEDSEEVETKKESKPSDEQPQTKGWMSKEAWIESGKVPEEWVSEDVFKERSLRIKETSRLKSEIKQKEADFDNRIKNLNTLQQAQLSRQREELLARRDEAIGVADKAEVKKIDGQLKELDKEADLVADKQQIEQQKPPEIVEWENDNPWINDESDPRGNVARETFQNAIASGRTLAGALRIVDAKMRELAVDGEQDKEPAKKKPPVSMADSSSSTPSKNNSHSLSWSSLNSIEQSIYDEIFAPSGVSKKDYLQTVADERRGKK
jgi:hypothetical protein